jgi:hypothetical protein
MTYTEAINAYAAMMDVSKSEAKEDAERMVKQWMTEGMTREFAENTFIEEQEDADPELIKKMEADAKKNGAKAKADKKPANYSMEKAVKTRAPRKPNEAKRAIVDRMHEAMQDFEGCEVVNPERQVDFIFEGVHYSITLTAHRAKKEKA